MKELRKIMKNNGEIIVKPIDKDLAKDICIKNHYSKKWNGYFGRYNFGIFKVDNPDICLGCAVFGAMMNAQSYKSINSKIKFEEIVELNRLWVDDCLGKNTETVFLSLCFKLLKQNTNIKIVQSFADGRLGCGTIYKASNFKYYGFHKTLFFENIETKETIHKTNLEDTRSLARMTGDNLGYIRGQLIPFYVKTYRYIYYIDREYEKYSLLKEETYPKYQKGKEYVEFKQSIHVLSRCYYCAKYLGFDDIKEEFKSFLLNNFEKVELKESLERALSNQTLLSFIEKNKDNKKQLDIINKCDKKYKKLH